MERPRNREHGDWATNVALQLAKPARACRRATSPTMLARAAARPSTGIAAVDVAGPGFLNIRLDAAAAGRAGPHHRRGRRRLRARRRRWPGQRINLEFVSANPTGPIHLGGIRWAAVGDALARILAGRRAPRSPASTTSTTTARRSTGSPARCWPRAAGEPAPEDGYGGAYIDDIAAQVRRGEPRTSLDLPDDEAQEVFRRDRRRPDVRRDQGSRCTTSASTSTSTSTRTTLHESGAVERAVDRLRELGHIYEDDGAIWLRTTDFGDDKDRVIIRADGAAGLHLRRPRLLPRQARARLRPGHHHARRRPPRLRRPDDGDVRRVRRHPDGQPRDPHRPDGQPASRTASRCG